jgi:hypothetical protein
LNAIFINCLLGSEQQLAEDIWFVNRKKSSRTNNDDIFLAVQVVLYLGSVLKYFLPTILCIGNVGGPGTF